jgi:protein O-GlcNAc transferase
MTLSDDRLKQAIASFQTGKLSDAERLFKEVLRHEPNHVAALNLLSVLLTHLGRCVEAEAYISQALKLNSNSDATFYNYGLILKKLKRPNEALERFSQALSINATVAETWNNRGTVLNDLKRYDDAIVDFNKAISLQPNYSEAFCNKAKSLTELKRYEEAFDACKKALSLKPSLAEGWLGGGNVFNELRRYDEAFSAYDKALSLKPDLAEAWLGRGNVFNELRRYDEAFSAYDKALSLKPDLAEAWLGRGNVFNGLNRSDEAFAAYDKALAFRPDLEGAWLGRGNVFFDLQLYEKALANYDKALALNPDLIGAEGVRLYSKMLCCNWSNIDTDWAQLTSSIKNKKANAAPFVFFGISSSPEDQLQCAKLWAETCFPQQEPIWQGERYRHDRIRLAYVSADFREHPVSFLIAGMLECHDKFRFDVTAISCGPDDNSQIRRRVKASFEHFIDAQTYSDDQIAKLVRSSEVDILVDLMGFTKGSRTNVFARRPTPIQVNYLGYPGTMGAEYIDYIIADQIVIPESHRKCYAEKMVYLPYSFMGSDSKRKISGRLPRRSEYYLPDPGFVFCSFNNSNKITPYIFDIWMRLLCRIDNSVLWLSQTNENAMRNLKREAQNRGVDPLRIIFAQRVPLNEEHLARYQLADLFLDTLPYNAHATASDALWAGLPVLTCLGETFAGRVAASMLNAIRLPELITTAPETYEQMAIDLATHPEKLAAIKRTLAENRLTAPLFDTKLFTKHIEDGYTAMYECHQAGSSRQNIVIRN